jgi:fructose-bisphosphate aldolase, class II
MPVPTSEQFLKMLKTAKEEHYAFPAINITSMDTANAALAAFAECKSDGIIQVSLGGGKFASGPLNDSVEGAIALATHIHMIAKKLGVFIALHTDHCQLEDIKFLKELIAVSAERKQRGEALLFNGHMFDGSALSLSENLKVAKELLIECQKIGIVPEFEAGVVGGEEEGAHSTNDHTKLYTTPDDMLKVADELFSVSKDFMFAATFGNVHGIYKPGNVKLEPKILIRGQEAVTNKYGGLNPLNLVFHGGSGTPVEQIHETLGYGVVKMNVDTATQYAYTRPIVDHMLKNYDGVLMIEGEVGNKKLYDPRSYLKKAIKSMSDRVVVACKELKSTGRSICG